MGAAALIEVILENTVVGANQK